jgi:maltose alpha-D-glucosyltransferase/alpha-amylase
MLKWLRNEVPRLRWFADKTRRTESVEIAWSAPVPGATDVLLTVARYRFESGPDSLYMIPFRTSIGKEASADPAFTTWLIDSLADRAEMPTELSWTRFPNAATGSLSYREGRLLGAEQSNTSIRYGDETLIKLNRRLTIGPSPEAELAAVIAKADNSSFAARSFGVLNLSALTDEPISVAIATEYMANVGDAWGYLVELLTEPDDAPGAVAAEVEQIADVTAAMHIGLTSDPWRRDVAPVPIRADDIADWERAGLDALGDLERMLSDLEATLRQDALRFAHLLPSASAVLREQLRGFTALRGTYRIRTHGDCHLGQLLRKPDGGYVVVDFDGEPNRPLHERRDKYSALRDVAGMLRSFAYARGTAERSDSVGGRSAAWLSWENRARDLFIRRYLERIAGQAVPLVPASPEDTRIALAALELEKAIYECGYELGNRPDWLWLPLSRLVRSG